MVLRIILLKWLLVNSLESRASLELLATKYNVAPTEDPSLQGRNRKLAELVHDVLFISGQFGAPPVLDAYSHQAFHRRPNRLLPEGTASYMFMILLLFCKAPKRTSKIIPRDPINMSHANTSGAPPVAT
ncbi:hypothetical protein SUNI508_03766 [Seiridium unicorne]|uniref:Uncharacterized protein n=1 Tax=Seiridium unicorne TaxID=138068 RepID=A0ABR2VB97_9PEZI